MEVLQGVRSYFLLSTLIFALHAVDVLAQTSPGLGVA
jgi:hypothetical protein